MSMPSQHPAPNPKGSRYPRPPSRRLTPRVVPPQSARCARAVFRVRNRTRTKSSCSRHMAAIQTYSFSRQQEPCMLLPSARTLLRGPGRGPRDKEALDSAWLQRGPRREVEHTHLRLPETSGLPDSGTAIQQGESSPSQSSLSGRNQTTMGT